jgi:hypothetical protein
LRLFDNLLHSFLISFHGSTNLTSNLLSAIFWNIFQRFSYTQQFSSYFFSSLLSLNQKTQTKPNPRKPQDQQTLWGRIDPEEEGAEGSSSRKSALLPLVAATFGWTMDSAHPSDNGPTN